MKDLTGKVFNKLKVISRTNIRHSNGSILWLCKCECGRDKITRGSSLTAGKTGSCGHCSHYKHGLCNTPEYKSWLQMKYRCYTQSCKDYKYYGARGIKVDDRWLGTNGFENFLNDVGLRPEPKFKYSLDRINNNSDYGPHNCRWATTKEQMNNRRLKTIENFSDEEIYNEFVKRGLVCLET